MPITEMLNTHPGSSTLDGEALEDCVDACYDCAQTCTACADACLGEEQVQNLIRCIRLNQDCADICETTGRILSRQTETDAAIVRQQLETLTEAVGRCADECARHADEHEHCRVCMNACRRCEETCRTLLTQLSQTAGA